jgi:hypothetical protein
MATRFGQSLDNDDFALTKTLLSPDCTYVIREDVLTGPDAIGGSYEQNMLAGRAKLDELGWGACTIEALNESEYFVHFTDFLTHKGLRHTHKCKQRVTVGEQGTIPELSTSTFPVSDSGSISSTRLWA